MAKPASFTWDVPAHLDLLLEVVTPGGLPAVLQTVGQQQGVGESHLVTELGQQKAWQSCSSPQLKNSGGLSQLALGWRES